MLALPSLNRRHKAGLFLVLVAAGLSLFFEASAKQTAGIILLGLAAMWFFGSVRPGTLGLILASTGCCVGLYSVIAPVWKEHQLYRTRVQAYDQVLSDIRHLGRPIRITNLDFVVGPGNCDYNALTPDMESRTLLSCSGQKEKEVELCALSSDSSPELLRTSGVPGGLVAK